MNALELRSPPPAIPDPEDFALHDLRIFTSIPEHRYYGIASLRGMVVVYAEDLLHIEGVIEGAFYVRESQRPVSGMSWDAWLREEMAERGACPRGRLAVTREVVKAVRWPKSDRWALRLASGFTDGPYTDWGFGLDLIGKVVGVYRP